MGLKASGISVQAAVACTVTLTALAKARDMCCRVFIEQGMTQSERLVKLNQIAIHQMSVLENSDNDRKLLK